MDDCRRRRIFSQGAIVFRALNSKKGISILSLSIEREREIEKEREKRLVKILLARGINNNTVIYSEKC